MDPSPILLPHKPSAPISHTFLPGRGLLSHHLIVFLNPLMMPSSCWYPAISHLASSLWATATSVPAILAYDRYGQGESAQDPSDEGNEVGYGHDLLEAVRDLHALMREVVGLYGLGPGGGGTLERDANQDDALDVDGVIFVASSIGCPLARLYASTHPPTPLKALLLLDSNMANTEPDTLFPDPDAAGFDPTILPLDTTPDEVRAVRARWAGLFHPRVRNGESLDRRSLAGFLPRADVPRLRGDPWVVVAGHDWARFAEECEKEPLVTRRSLTEGFVNPTWGRYNEGLVRLSARGEGPVIARGCGHFIQGDDPEFVAGWVDELVQRVKMEGGL